MKKFWNSFITIVYAVIFAVVIRTFAFEPFNIPTGSMIPTVLIGDYLFVSKYSYGYSRHAIPLAPPLFSGRIFAKTPERGDVAVFKLPSNDRIDYIKRIVGLPGDRVMVREGMLHVNNLPVARRQVRAPASLLELGPFYANAPIYEESFANGNRHYVIELGGDEAPLDDTPVFTVPEDHFFVMGDNRDNSQDSRARDRQGQAVVGFVPSVNLVGKAQIIFFSERCGRGPGELDCSLWRPWTWPSAVRWERILKTVW